MLHGVALHVEKALPLCPNDILVDRTTKGRTLQTSTQAQAKQHRYRNAVSFRPFCSRDATMTTDARSVKKVCC